MPTLTWGFLMVKNTEGINTIFLTRNSRSKNCVYAFHASMATNLNSYGHTFPITQSSAIYYNAFVASLILGLGLAVFGYRERAVILLTALFLGLQNSKVDLYRKTCKIQLCRHTYLLSKTSRFLDNPNSRK